MTSASVGQAGVEYLYRTTPAAFVAQAGVEYLHRVQPTMGISQAGVEILHKALPCTTARAQIWRITRTDGEVLRFTSLDRDFEFGGHTYHACNSMTPSASEGVAEVGGIGSIELTGLIASGAVSMFDLHAGAFDNADVECWLVPWRGTESPKCLLKGTFGEVTYTENGFRTDITGDGAKLTQTPLTKTLEPGCRWQFCDSNCGKDAAALTVTGTVDSGRGQRGFTDADRAETAGYFSRGRVTFTSGNNAGVSAEIKEHAEGGVFTLWPRLPFHVNAGDEYEMLPGCTNLKDSSGGTNGCTAWGRYDPPADDPGGYGGAPFVPGADAIAKTADQKPSD